MAAAYRHIQTRGDKCPCGGYIDPKTLEKLDPTRPDPLAELVKSCDRLKKELEQTKFSNTLQDIVCETSASSPSAVLGQKRHGDSSNLRHSQPTIKLRKTHLRSHLSSVQSQPTLLPPPQTEPVNLSSKLTINNQSTRVPSSITPPSPISSPISATNMLVQLLILSGMFPNLLKMSPQLCSPPPSSPSISLWTPIGSLFTPSQQIQAAFYP
ncbi:unnamed protein product [Hymenolepis diminuta]|uniref:BHLH domain-containing protein n=2 Tax=Hymenolepis diminuta TaxID=6216 RepID=A0A0R3SBD1_HYMDI|nr:unnamed protein product [Hymenolepis diminuta]